MSENDFMRQQQAAVERMREMSRKAAETQEQPMPPVPPFVRLQNRSGSTQNRSIPSGGRQDSRTPNNNMPSNEKSEDNFPFPARKGGLSSLPLLDMLGSDGDLPLIIGLLLILFGEKADKKLLFALIYILL